MVSLHLSYMRKMFNTQFNLEVFSEFVMIIYEAWVAIFHSLLIHHGGN